MPKCKNAWLVLLKPFLIFNAVVYRGKNVRDRLVPFDLSKFLRLLSINAWRTVPVKMLKPLQWRCECCSLVPLDNDHEMKTHLPWIWQSFSGRFLPFNGWSMDSTPWSSFSYFFFLCSINRLPQKAESLQDFVIPSVIETTRAPTTESAMSQGHSMPQVNNKWKHGKDSGGVAISQDSKRFLAFATNMSLLFSSKFDVFMCSSVIMGTIKSIDGLILLWIDPYCYCNECGIWV